MFAKTLCIVTMLALAAASSVFAQDYLAKPIAGKTRH